MYSKWIDILNKAYCDHVAFTVTYYLKLKLFPSKDRLLNKNLTYKTCLKTSCTYNLKLFLVVYETAAGSTHCVSRTKYYRIT